MFALSTKHIYWALYIYALIYILNTLSGGSLECWETCPMRDLLMLPLPWKGAVTSWTSSGLKTQSKLQYHDFSPSKFSQKGNYYAGSFTNTACSQWPTMKGWPFTFKLILIRNIQHYRLFSFYIRHEFSPISELRALMPTCHHGINEDGKWPF